MLLIVVAVVFAVVVATGGASWLAGVGRTLAGDGEVGVYACADVGGPPPPEYCARAAADFAKRARVTHTGDPALVEAVREINRVASRGERCPTPVHKSCFERPVDRQPTAADARIRQDILIRRGYDGAIVRLAGPLDPALPAWLVYAAPVGELCVVGHVKSVPSGGGAHEVMGQLPEGGCLAAE